MLSCSYWKILSYKSSNLRHVHLLIKNNFLNNENVRAASGKVFEVINPATGKVLAQVADMGVEETKNCVEQASCAFQEWQLTTAKQRAQLLRRWFNLLEENSEDIAKVLTAESGKPITESRTEVAYGNSFIEWFSEVARTVLGNIIPSPVSSKKILVEKAPIGVVGLITPWNFPHAMITRKAAPALAAGCTCVIRPSEDTPLTAMTIVELANRAGFPKGVVNLVTSSRAHAAAIGQFLCKSPLVAGISFTGSTAVGKILYRNCSSGIKHVALELGGNAPFIVFESADICKAVDGAMKSKFRNAGQTCVAANRFLIQSSIHDCFVHRFREQVQLLKMGDGMREDVTIGPLINKPHLEKVSGVVEDAVSKGACVVIGGKQAADIGQLFYEPTILTNLTENMVVYNEEVFGPVAGVIRFDTEEQAIEIANSTLGGLASYFYSENVNQIFRVSKLLQAGMVGVNEGLISMPEAPFGGVKESGLGREGSVYGIDDYTYVKYICLGALD